MKTSTRTKGFICGVIASSLLLAFTGTGNAESLVALGVASGVQTQFKIGIFDSSDAFIDIVSFKPLTGIRAESFFIDMDLRPSNNKIYALALNFESLGFDIYTIDPFTGSSQFVTDISELSYNPLDNFTSLDIDPIADRTSAASIKLVSNGGSSYVINADTGALTQGERVAPGFAGVAYTHSDSSMPLVAPANTQIYYINRITQTLAATLFPLDNPAIRTVGRLGVDVEERLFSSSFEIARSGNAYASFFNGEQFTLNTINLNTGAATQTGIFNGGVSGLTSAPVSVVPEPETYAYMLSGLALVGLVARRKNIQI